MKNRIRLIVMLIAAHSLGCQNFCPPPEDSATDDGPVAEGISSRLGDPLPTATAEQLAIFNRGKEVAMKQFDLADGLGPAFNVVSCLSCHERPAGGGSAGLYRNFFLAGFETADGVFIASDSAGPAGGVLRVFNYDVQIPFRPPVPPETEIFGQRNPIPMFGTGLIAELSDEEILLRADPDDSDGDGISGRANFDRGFVGRFGRKSQTVSIEGFIRGPLFNHMGVTTVPLSDEQRMQLPVDSSAQAKLVQVARRVGESKFDRHAQVAAPDAANADDDGVADPEMSTDELFDLVSFSMLLAAPQLEEPTEQSNRGRLLFHEAGCSDCHTPRLNGPRGPLPMYSDLLIHDMGEALADGIVMKEATGSEFRTQPLWGLSAVGPYLHDGRAERIEDAILAHGGEAQASRDAFAGFSEAQKADVAEFLLSLGGRDQFSTGLVEPNTPIADVGEYGGPFRELNEEEQAQFLRGRELYDRDFGHATGVGGLVGSDSGPRFNGDSCRACHFDPVIGGAGPRDVNVMRHGMMDGDGMFTPPATTPNTILHKQIKVGFTITEAEAGINVFEHRQTPHTLGLGLMDAISEATILSNADPEDADADGISGKAHMLADGRIGRLGWKANVPSVAEFVRDAMAAEIGITMPEQEGLTFGITSDTDGTPDPELTLSEAEDLAFFITMLAGPPRQTDGDPQQVAAGEALFESIGCAKCHMPSLPSSLGDVPLYSNLLLHEILPEGAAGIGDGSATPREFRTAPLWGLSQTAPYFHSGEADTIDQAIRLHAGEATAVRQTYEGFTEADREALLAFLGSL
jgi:CxxC motif-containing protein (DUF1111 family)